jgi:hypothetical protein
VLALAAASAASAQTTFSYWISMRTFATDPAPIFVAASPTQTAQQTVAIQACDGNTYYLAQSDYNTMQTELQNPGVVQLNVAPQGTAANASGTLCVIQAPPPPPPPIPPASQ